MQARYFRYLFENSSDGIFHSGSIYDKAAGKVTNYIYLLGNDCRDAVFHRKRAVQITTEHMPQKLDIIVMGSYTAEYIKKLLEILETHKAETIILPYLTPIQRLVFAEETQGNKEAARFLQDPYMFLKNKGIANIYLLYGNGSAIGREPEELEFGCQFEAADEETLRLIREMEGYAVPVVKAGYMIENGWLFYFGMFGLDIQKLSEFTKEYFSHIENIDVLSENRKEDYRNQMKNLVKEYMGKFGSAQATTIAMYEGPLNASQKENDSFMAQKEFSGKDGCSAWVCTPNKESSCTIRCLYQRDYDTMQRHKSRLEQETRFGILMLGNVNLNVSLSEIVTRFWRLHDRIRGIGIADGGNRESWNPQILNFLSAKDRLYWICNKNRKLSSEVISDIILSSPQNRFLAVQEKEGVCFSGYLIPKETVER